ncbi:MAG: ABC transporter permease [Oscillospiraceae bacterium]|nr:ABC transporter permease [Oscillospiraceae bacterium]
MSEPNHQYHIHIQPKNGWFDIDLKELWRYRDLIWLFTKKNFILVYKQTILGPAWIVLQPLMTTLIYTLVFGGIAGIPTDGVPQLLFYMGGTAVWGFFAACLNKTASTFTGNAGVFGKVYFPRLVMPISTVLSSAVNFGVQLAMFLVFWIYYVATGQVTPNYAGILLLPLVMGYLGLLALGCGVIISSLTTKYRDLAMLVGFGVQLWMYITPVVYPLSTLGDGMLRTVIMMNPVTCAVETFRWMFLGAGDVNALSWIVSTGVMAVIVAVGVMVFSKVEKTFMDTV